MFKNRLIVLNVTKLALNANNKYDNYMIKQRENNTFYNKIIGINTINKR